MLYCFQVQVQCSGLEPLPGTYRAGSGTRLRQVPGCVRYDFFQDGMPPSPALCILNYDNLCDGFSPLGEMVIISYSSHVVHSLVDIQ